MISQLPNGVRVPTGFATTAHAFRAFLKHDGLVDRINQKLDTLDVEDVRTLSMVGAEIRQMVEAQPFPADLENAIRDQFAILSAGNLQASFAVRSSATAEDLPDASFAGQQETFLNVVGIEDVLHKMKEVFASCTTTEPSVTAFTKVFRTQKLPCLRACNAWSGRTWVRQGHVHHRYRNWF